jgi:hypothetical protein
MFKLRLISWLGYAARIRETTIRIHFLLQNLKGNNFGYLGTDIDGYFLMYLKEAGREDMY